MFYELLGVRTRRHMEVNSTVQTAQIYRARRAKGDGDEKQTVVKSKAKERRTDEGRDPGLLFSLSVGHCGSLAREHPWAHFNQKAKCYGSADIRRLRFPIRSTGNRIMGRWGGATSEPTCPSSQKRRAMGPQQLQSKHHDRRVGTADDDCSSHTHTHTDNSCGTGRKVENDGSERRI
ncbi:hypothetical protein F2P81_015396 [Scophthalmus maximus]|uniref:Uncharacterized protein n=1 Tax=Scophthalmus maximus TaxID=52904 RepID=A0A6A4SD85_SCOMX|nr:hypothetical protein F2P81_015396 [Scophthalmus maximus]